MMSWNSPIFCWNSSRVGNAISDNSLIGVPSCFSGGRRMVKCTRSTEASDLSRLRQVRSPACGSPETRSTRSLSRTPSMVTTARLLTVVNSPGSGAASISTMFWPPCGIAISTFCGIPTGTVRVSMTSPSRRTVTAALVSLAPWSSTLYVIVCDWPTMPKRGAAIKATRRSRSSLLPVMSAWIGAAKPSAPASCGTSWTRPSVIMMTPATRSVGTSASVVPSAVNNRVPSVSPSDWPASMTRTSRPGIWLSRSTTAVRAASVCCVRSPKFWLGLLSTTTTATEESGSRSSRVSDGLASASTTSPSASARIVAPRLRDTNSNSARMTAAATAAHNTGSATSGANAIPRFNISLLLPQSLEQRRHVHLIGFVIAGQRVHDDVDTGAERELALARLAFHHRQHGLAVGPRRPGAGQIVRGDDDGGHAVAAARRTSSAVLVDVRQRLDPQLAGIEAAGEVAQQIECLGQHVIARHRLELGQIERGQDITQLQHSRAARLAARTGRRDHGIAGVEQHGAAVLHVGVDALERRLRRPRRAGRDRPINQRIKRQFVMRDIEADRVAWLERGALRQEKRQAGEAGFADIVDLGIAGDHISKLGLERRRRHIADPDIFGARLVQRQRQNREENGDAGRGARETRHQPLNAATEEQHHHGIEQEQQKRGEQDRPAQILWLADAVDFMARIGERREIERRQAIGRGERVHRDETFGRAVKARWMIGRRACGIIRRDRTRGRRRRDEIAETVEHAAWRHHFAHAFGLRFGGVGDAGGAGERHDAPEHFDESARQRQIGPARVAGDV